jgi:hypothetical protein
MSAIATAKQNAINAEKAKMLDDMERQQKNQQAYELGAADVQELLRQQVEADLDRKQQEAYNRYYPNPGARIADDAFGTGGPRGALTQQMGGFTQGLAGLMADGVDAYRGAKKAIGDFATSMFSSQPQSPAVAERAAAEQAEMQRMEDLKAQEAERAKAAIEYQLMLDQQKGRK